MSTLPNIDPAVAEATLKKLYAQREQAKRFKDASEKARESFRAFIPQAWDTVEPAKPFMPGAWHIDAIADHLQAVYEGHIQNLLITVPPGSAKSVLAAVMFPSWVWTKNPRWRATFASYDSGLSTRDSVRCRELLKSEWYQSAFTPEWKFSTTQDEKTYFVNTEKGWRVSTSVGGSGKGTGWRADATILDDAESTDASDAEMELCTRWWENVMYNRLIDMRTGSRINIQQRINDRDLTGHLLRQGGWEHLKIPMEYDPARSKVTTLAPGKEWRDPRANAGELMFPTLFPDSVIRNLKKNRIVWAAQYQQEPTVDGGGIFKSHKWSYWQPNGMDLPPVRVLMPDRTVEERKAVDLPDSFDIELQGWDMAFKDLKTSDFVVGQVVGSRGARRFLLGQERGQMNLPDSMAAVRRLTANHPKAHLKLIEDKANGPAVIQMLQDSVPGLVPVNPEGGKVARASAISPEQEAGNWYLPHPMLYPWVGDPEEPLAKGGFIAEATLFPNGKNDDQIDCLSMIGIRIQHEAVSGAFGVSDADVTVAPFDFDDKWPRIYGIFVNFEGTDVVWMARRPETGQYYIYAEYSSTVADPSSHAAAVRKCGDWIAGAMHVTIRGRDQRDGYGVVGKYRNLGLKLHAIANREDAEILDLAEAFTTGKLKVFGSLAKFLAQFRMFRRDDNGHLPRYNCGVIHAASAAWASRDRAVAKSEPNRKGADRSPLFEGSNTNTWMSS
jgi:predicted phage terminase large subunit-like protein